jgi:hypothetical protein
MSDYFLEFDALRSKSEAIVIRDNKRLFLCRAPQVVDGTATVVNVDTEEMYVIPDGHETIRIIDPPASLTLAFVERSNDKIGFVIATVKT